MNYEEKNDTKNSTKEPFTEYINGVKIGMGTYDFIFDFTLSGSGVNKEIGTIVMSPEHAKVFSHMLQDNINQYEAVFGTIPTAPNNEKMQELLEKGIIKQQGED